MSDPVSITQDSFGSILARAFRSRSFVIGFILTAIIALMAGISFFWTPYDVTKLIVSDRMQPPSAAHWFGTDHFGRDNFSMMMVPARRNANCSPSMVSTGIMALRKACRQSTYRHGMPLARAVRM